MKISHGTRIADINNTNGYGYATERMIDSLTRLGHEVKQNNPDAPVQFWFDQPHHWKWNEDNITYSSPTSYTGSHQYRIGYHPWESTKLKDDWVDRLNQCDEVWTPSPVIADWYREDGVKPPVYVYEHGVDKIWTPKRRELGDGPMVFLHCGGEAARKRADRTMQAFRAAFADRKDVKLVLKLISPGWNVPMNGKITVINKRYDIGQLVDLFHQSHVYLYPSHGEGFGLTPLQAMATGMPTITVPAWAPYAEFIDPKLAISSELKNSPYPQVHPGKMWRPDFDEMVDIMRWTADNYETAQDFAHSQVAGIQKKYDWDALTADAFNKLSDRLNQ